MEIIQHERCSSELSSQGNAYRIKDLRQPPIASVVQTLKLGSNEEDPKDGGERQLETNVAQPTWLYHKHEPGGQAKHIETLNKRFR